VGQDVGFPGEITRAEMSSTRRIPGLKIEIWGTHDLYIDVVFGTL
jgi:hypothetical protein